jgi:hypothetical protein
MTSSTTTIKAVSNGTTADPQEHEHGLAQLRAKESKALISMACDALHETSAVTHTMHGLIFDRNQADDPGARIRARLEEALACMETAEHYLRMLDSALDERTADSQAPWPAYPAL